MARVSVRGGVRPQGERSPADDETLTAHVGRAEHRAVGGVEASHARPRVHHERPQDLDLVSEAAEGLHNLGRDAIFHLEDPARPSLSPKP